MAYLSIDLIWSKYCENNVRSDNLAYLYARGLEYNELSMLLLCIIFGFRCSVVDMTLYVDLYDVVITNMLVC